MLKVLADRYNNVEFNQKGGSTVLRHTKLVITSNYRLEDLLNMTKIVGESYDAIMNRFTRINVYSESTKKNNPKGPYADYAP